MALKSRSPGFYGWKDAVKSSWKIAALVSCVIPICGAAITRHLVKARADQRKLSEDANVYRARAEQGDAEAQFNLARAYYHGQDASGL